MGYATDGQLPRDTNGAPAEGVYTPNVGTVAQQGGVIGTDAQGTNYAPTVVQLLSGVANQTPADSTAAANLFMLVAGLQSGTGLFTPRRIITKFVQLKAQAVTAATPVDVYTPTTGKKFRILSYHVSLSVAGSVLFEDTTGTEVLRTPLMAAGVGQPAPDLGNGYPSSAANNHIFIDVTASGIVSGWIGIMEE